MKLLHAAAAITISLSAVAADAAERLTQTGVALPAQTFAPGGALEATIDPAGDEVLSVHTLIRPASTNIVMMRDRDGFWVEWDGDRDALAPAAARQDGDLLTYKIFQSPPPGVRAMTVTVAYRTPQGIKFGWFEAATAGEGSN